MIRLSTRSPVLEFILFLQTMTAQIKVKWNPKNLQIRSRAVQQQLQPLITQVTTLVNSEKSTKKRRGKSKKGAVLLAVLDQAITNFIEKGEQIAIENQEITEDMLVAVNDIRTTGGDMNALAQQFILDPCSSIKRSEMIKAARNLLAAVTHLLILADMVDVQLLLTTIDSVVASLEKLRTSTNHDQLMEDLKNYSLVAGRLLNESGKRQQQLIDPESCDNLAYARATLKKSSTMLISAAKTYIAYPDNPAAVANKDHVLRQICEAVDTISDITQGKASETESIRTGRLAGNLETLENPSTLDYNEDRMKTLLQQQIDELVSGVTLISESGRINNERKNNLMSGCAAVREALQELMTQSMTKPNLDEIGRKAKQLRRQLHKAIADEVSDNFDNSPLELLVTAAKAGDAQQVETLATIFTEHCKKLIEVANHVCEVSNNEEGTRMVRLAAWGLPGLCEGVINAARILAEAPQSSTSLENMDAFKKAWEEQLEILQTAVDDVTTIDDVLSVLDQKMYDEMNQYISAVQERDPEKLRTIAQEIRNRTTRIIEVVTGEMDNYEPCLYTRKVLTAVKLWNDDIEKFNAKTEAIIESLTKNPELEIDENEFLDATRLIYDGVREVRRAVLMNRADEELDPEEVELEETTTYSTNTVVKKVMETVTRTEEPMNDNMSGFTVLRHAMEQMPEKEKTKLLEQVENFQYEKLTFDKEVAKWEDRDNDIIALAKFMCIIMMQMTDFVRQKGPLKTTTDVINAAKTLSASGIKLNKLTQEIAEQCPGSSTKQDLIAYTERVDLYSHQINIISKVKTDVENNSNEELIIAGVESATSLIENAKNLMNAVVLLVKASYVASTKYSKQGVRPSPIVVWKMKVPEKKPLVRLEKRKEIRAVVRKASQRKPQNPVAVLAEFENL